MVNKIIILLLNFFFWIILKRCCLFIIVSRKVKNFIFLVIKLCVLMIKDIFFVWSF